MATNTSALKTFAQQTRIKLISLVTTKMNFVLHADTAELRGKEREIAELKQQIDLKGEDLVVEEVAYTWFNRVMAFRFMDANVYTAPRIVTPAEGQTRPEILQEAMGGSIDEELGLSADDRLLPEAALYRRLLVAECNRYGSSMPFLFERIKDYTELLLPDDLLSDNSFVADIRLGMTDEDCRDVELMGWLYQFYITDRKADAEEKKGKRGGLKSDEQAAATQLFTPHWIVRYMVENSLGRIWMTLHPESPLRTSMPYYIESEAKDVIPEDIHRAEDIRFLDPCMGSGHVLVYAFDLFCKMYEEEGYSSREIPAMVLTNNLFGFDIDRRCYQLAAFALTMKARGYFSRYFRRTVSPHLLALQPICEDALLEAGVTDRNSMLWQMQNIDTIGSLLRVTREEAASVKVVNGVVWQEQTKLLKEQAEALSGKYHCVVTNPPYLGKGKCDSLASYLVDNYPNSKTDTMATFMERCLEYSISKGKVSMINMQSWMFLSSFEDLRMDLLESTQIDNLLHLGPHAFNMIGGELVQCAAFVLGNHKPNVSGTYYRLIDGKSEKEKESAFLKREGQYIVENQKDFEKIPGCPIGYWANERIIANFRKNKDLSKELDCLQGIITGNTTKYLRIWSEINYSTLSIHSKIFSSSKYWVAYTKGGSVRKWYGNNEYTIFWKNGGNYLVRNRSTNSKYYLKPCFTWSLIGSTSFSARFCDDGFLWDVSGSIGVPLHHNWKTVLGFMNTKLINLYIKILNPTINTNIEDVNALPIAFTIGTIIEPIEDLVESNISISKLDWDSHETSWDFKRNPIIEEQLQVFVDELSDVMPELDVDSIKDYHMPDMVQPIEVLVENYKAKWEDLFHQLHHNEEELNRQFIEIYGLQDELTPDVPLDEITILQQGEISIEEGKIVWHNEVIIKQLISYLVGCFMGRYSVDKPGLIIASQHTDLNSLGLRVDGVDNGAPGRLVIDDDGIVPILEGEYFSDDMTVRIEEAIKTLMGEAHYQENIKYIETCLGKTIRAYLYKDFYTDHVKLYQKRPIYWLVSSKMGDRHKQGVFKALLYIHRIESDTLSKLHADYVVSFIDKVDSQLCEAEELSGRDDLSQAQRNKAIKEVDRLQTQMRELRDFEQELVQMASQRLTIDLDDGVRLNYPKFYPLVEPIKGLDKSED